MARVYVRDWLYTYGVNFFLGSAFSSIFDLFEIVLESPVFSIISQFMVAVSGGISDGNFSR